MAEIHRITTRPWTLMEVCGGQTHTIVKQGIDEALPDGRADDPRARLPGLRDAARAGRQGARHRRPPGRHLHQLRRHAARARAPRTDLLALKARGADVRIVYCRSTRSRSRSPTRTGRSSSSPSASRRPRPRTRWPSPRPPGAASTTSASSCRHVLVPPAMTALLESPTNQVQAFLAAGHVCAVMGWTEYEPIAAKYRVPIVVTGLRAARPARGHPDGDPPARGGPRRGREPVRPRRDARGRARWPSGRSSRCSRSASASGAASARSRCPATACARSTRGSTPSGSSTSATSTRNEHPACIAGAILTGEKTPLDCTAYGTLCTPAEAAGRADGQLRGHLRRVLLRRPRPRRGGGSPLPAMPLVQVAPIGGGRRRRDERGRPSSRRRLAAPTIDRGRRRLPGADPRGRAGHPGPRLGRPAVERADARPASAPALARGVARRRRSTTRPSSRSAGHAPRVHHGLVRRVSPIRFPGGDIGELAVNGTINDLAMMGAPAARDLASPTSSRRGCRSRSCAAITASAARAAARAGRPDRHRRHEGRGARRRGPAVRQHRGDRPGARRRRARRRTGRGPATRSSCRARSASTASRS